MKTILQTPRVLMRQFAEDEIDHLLTMNADERIARYITRRTPAETRELFAQMQIDYINKPELGRWALINAEDGDFIGLCMLLEARAGMSGTEIGYSLNYKYWGQGLATEVVRATVDYGFNILNLQDICAITTIDNALSQRVLLKTGFKPTGTVVINNRLLPLYINSKGDQ
ncbi:GNAT family N-acetyltransferase [Mucilaginibacter jinjuensis]|uniref:GNAT family N-acetyltransferase n=1 Tax=Mucilaginibacter jinjuensis TaxID=1176721 RepID=A0ABY7TAW4_9SPHI|nr:GNAT family N-acetyltransferase [Mucilaginibacter jinjuensis]WCT12367.1 GNAT family N-acetyltransferase [Mucilaginibacter jinjuensis]